MINTPQTSNVVATVNHPSLKMQFDTGAIIINKEDPLSISQDYKFTIGHVHLSEPWLLPLCSNKDLHTNISKALKMNLSDHIFTIEMLTTNEKNSLSVIRESIEQAMLYYAI